MAEFMGDFVVLTALAMLSWGFWKLDVVKRESRGTPAKVAAWVLIVAGVGTALCASYYMFQFRSAGDFDRAYPPALVQVHDMDMMKKMMGDMMHKDGAPGAATASPDEHAGHH